ncbi:uncharacterized protein LOC106085916 [Stomoxys calcitrans]|uniref:DUF4789 domain-containing protein n=1 Tax=Stomoxys calcitrans TaxID=35570 RepID=A0A1I8PRS0_STOCA|nr:uncharacterized protein LOC106085916 [Stomoxys calcitrans]
MSVTVSLCWGFYLLFGLHVTLGQLAYPESLQTDKSKSNIDGRLPLYSPARCKQHELLYPGDQKDDWICDCAPAALYYPESDACFPAFRRGPCERNEILVLGNDAIIPECIPNACKVDGQIQIHNVCYELGKAGPCPNPQLSYVVGVDPKTLHIDCVKLSISVESRFGDEPKHNYDLTNVEKCARGSKRAVQGRCPS